MIILDRSVLFAQWIHIIIFAYFLDAEFENNALAELSKIILP